MNKQTTENDPDANEFASPNTLSSIAAISVAIGLTILQVILLLTPGVSLGVSGEWAWPQIPAGNAAILTVLLAILLSAGYLVFLWRGGRWLDQSGRSHKLTGFLLLIVATWILIPTFRSIPSGIYGTAGLSWITYYPRMSGYYSAAMQDDQSYSEFLAGYEEVVRQGDYLHQGTHPPGLILYFRLLKTVCTASPEFSNLLIRVESSALHDGLNVLEQLAQENGQTFSQASRAVLSLNLWITYFAAAVTVIPLFLIVHQFASFRAAWLVAGLWPLIPSLAVFAPKSDLLLPFFSTMTAACWIVAVRKKSLGLSLLAGLIFWCGCLISLAVLVVPVILAVWVILDNLFETWFREHNRIDRPAFLKFSRRLPWKSIAGSLAIFIAMTVAVALLFEMNLWTIWRLNLQNHASFYDHNSRTYFAWLLVNPLELTFTLGPAVTLLVLGTLFFGISQRKWTSGTAWTLSVVIVWGFLWISGKNMGEAARLWIFLTPLFLSAGGGLLERWISSPSPVRTRMLYLCLFVCQALVALVAVMQIDAFDFSSFLR